MTTSAQTISFKQKPVRTLNANIPRLTADQVRSIIALPFNDLLFQAHSVHRENCDPNKIELATLVSIKTGGCPEDCSYCPQSVHHNTGLQATKLMEVPVLRQAALAAKEAGATRFCMGAAWRSPKDRDIDDVVELIQVVKSIGMESCATLGMLTDVQAQRLKEAGLDYYNHNLDTAPELYSDIISTRQYQDRLDTLRFVRDAGVHVCSGGIVGMGESRDERADFLWQLANLDPYPESVPINHLVKVAGTPLADQADLDPLEFVRTIATARIIMPKAKVRLSAGRQQMSDAVQALCFFAGANSIFYGEKLLTTDNPDLNTDRALLAKLGLSSASSAVQL